MDIAQFIESAAGEMVDKYDLQKEMVDKTDFGREIGRYSGVLD